MKVQNEMSTRISVDAVSAIGSMSAFRNAIRGASDAWRAQETALKNSGNYAEAAKTRLSGLNQVIDLQKAKVEELRQRQEGLDTSNKKQANQFIKLEKQIQQANRQLASYEGQAKRAAQSVDLENSGILRLNSNMKVQSALASATAERLRSQGHSYEAMGVEVNNLRFRLDTLKNIQRQEVQLLSSTKARMGEASTEYLKQATRVQELGTKIQNTRNKVDQLNATMRRTPTGWLGKLSSRLDNIQGKADRVSTSFGRIFGATAAANLFTGALGSISARIGDMTRAGIDYNIEQNKMLATWTTLTGSANKANPMIDSINKMAQATGQDVDVVNELEQGFYHLNSSKKQADGMTSALLNMADAVGLNGEQIKAVEQDMVHGMATGKITQGELNQIGQYFPMIDEAMAKHFNTTVKGMRQMAKAGKITSKDLQDVFEQLGNGKYKKAADNMMNSYFGVFRTIKARTPQLIGDITSPFMKISNPLLQSVRKWINDKSTDAEFKRLGSQMAKSMNQVISAFGGSKLSSTKIMDDAIKHMTDGVRELGNVVSKHHREIANFFSSFKEGSAAQTKIFANIFVDLSKVLLPVLNLMAKFPKTSAALITSFMLASRAVKGLQSAVTGLNTIKNVGNSISDFSKKVRGIPNKKTTKVEADTAIADRRISTTQGKIKALPKKATSKVTVESRQAVKNINSVATASKASAATAKISFASIRTAAVTSIKGIGVALRANPLGVLITGIQVASTAFKWLYKNSKTFRNFVNGLKSTASKGMKAVGKWFGNTFKSIEKQHAKSVKQQQRQNKVAQRNWDRHMKSLSKGWNRFWKNYSRTQTAKAKQSQKSWNTLSQNTTRVNDRMWKSVRKSAQNGWSNFRKTVQRGTRNVNRLYQGMQRQTGSLLDRMRKEHPRTFNAMYKQIEDRSKVWHDLTSGHWNRLSADTANVAKDMANTSRSIFGDMYDKLNDLTGGRLGQMRDTWNKVLGQIHDAVVNIGGTIHRAWDSLMNGISDVFGKLVNGVIDGINWVLNHVGGSGNLGHFNVGHFAKGSNGPIAKRQLAVLNDAPDEHYREIVHKHNSGKTFMLPAKRNILMPLEPGDEVLDGKRSAQLMQAMGIPHYANGAIGNFFEGIFDKAGDALDDATDWVESALKDVVGFGKSLFNHFIKSVTPKATDSLGTGLKLNLPTFFATRLESWLKKQLDLLNTENPPGTGVERWRPVIIRAFNALHVAPAEWKVAKLLRQIQTESGGNPDAWQGIHDVNSGGNEARGLLQFAGSTWAADALPGHTDWHKGYNEILAAISVLERGGEGGWGNVGNGHGWAYGGLVTQHGVYEVAEGNNPEMIVPLDPNKRGRAYSLLSQILARFKGEEGTSTVNDSSENQQMASMNRKFDALLSQNQHLLGLIDKLIGVTDSANNPTARYKRTQRDINIAQSQSFI